MKERRCRDCGEHKHCDGEDAGHNADECKWYYRKWYKFGRAK